MFFFVILIVILFFFSKQKMNKRVSNRTLIHSRLKKSTKTSLFYHLHRAKCAKCVWIKNRSEVVYLLYSAIYVNLLRLVRFNGSWQANLVYYCHQLDWSAKWLAFNSLSHISCHFLSIYSLILPFISTLLIGICTSMFICFIACLANL